MPRSRWRRAAAIALGVATLAAPGTLTSSASSAPSDRGYWLVGADGGVYEFGGALFKGSLAEASSGKPIAAMVPSPLGLGYWLAGANGGVSPFGDARFLGSMGGTPLNRPVVGMAATPSGNGYWLVAADGGIFSFGDARFLGGMGGQPLNRPVVGMAATPSGNGYWLVAADGGIFTFGDARFLGGMGGQPLNRPVVGMAATPSGDGYWLVASDGGIFTFGAARFLGSMGGTPPDHPIVDMTTTPHGDGYWLADSGGDVYHFGEAEYSGEADDCPLPAGIVGIAASGVGTAAEPPPPRPNCGIPTTTTTTTAPSGGSSSSFDIGLVGDTGYTTDQEAMFLRARSHMNGHPLAFVVHDGDFKSGSQACSDWRYRAVRDVFNGFEAPFIFTPGDNDWEDCTDELGRLAFLRSVFFPTDESLGQHRIRLTRQHPTYVENARWVRGNVVFATLNLPGSDGRSSSSSETQARIAADVAWLHATFDLAEEKRSPGVMIIWQDNPFSTAEPSTLAALKARTIKFGKPVVLVHGDTHVYRLDHPWSDVPKFTRLETYATSQSNKWVKATVDPASSSVFSFRSMTAS